MFSSQRVMQAATPKQKLKPEEDDNCYSRDRAPRMARQAKQQGSEHILARQTMSSPTALQKFGPKPRESKTIQSIQHNDSCKQGRNDKRFRCADPQASIKFESTVSSENQCAETTTRRYRNSASISEMSKQPSRQCNGQELSIPAKRRLRNSSLHANIVDTLRTLQQWTGAAKVRICSLKLHRFMVQVEHWMCKVPGENGMSSGVIALLQASRCHAARTAQPEHNSQKS